ncbi:MAG: STAS domain-containing protein [Candidatus Woesearchaeota archaeon]
MEVSKSFIDDKKVVVRPKENIDFSNSNELKEELLRVYEDGYNQIDIDFTEVDRIDSSGLGKLLLFHKRLKEKKGNLVIKNIESNYIKNMFDMIHLDKIIEIED